jgi:CheY-like chemotaxis protein
LTLHGYAVVTASDAHRGPGGHRAQKRPQLILMDLQMPGIDGFELTRLLKANPPGRPDMPDHRRHVLRDGG